MAGGTGSRLGALSATTPKALLGVGNSTLVGQLLDRLLAQGMDEAVLCIGPRERLGVFHERLGEGWRGVPLRYCMEDQPLGTAGCLSLIEGLARDFLVVNCDIVTDLSFAALFEDHCRQSAAATAATGTWVERLRFGAVQCSGDGRIHDLEEKPEVRQEILLGAYAINRDAATAVLPRPPQRVDMPDLLSGLIRHGKTVRSHHSDAPWSDVGTREDYERLRDAAKATT